jgi:hypothetical protein
MANNCPRCGKNLALVGNSHRCMANKPDPVANKVDIVANEPIAMANTKTYRYRDAEKRKAYMREYMRKKRDGRGQDSRGGLTPGEAAND